MNMKLTARNYPVVMAAAAAALSPIVVKFAGDNSWAHALWFGPITGIGTWIGCRLGQWWFGRSPSG